MVTGSYIKSQTYQDLTQACGQPIEPTAAEVDVFIIVFGPAVTVKLS